MSHNSIRLEDAGGDSTPLPATPCTRAPRELPASISRILQASESRVCLSARRRDIACTGRYRERPSAYRVRDSYGTLCTPCQVLNASYGCRGSAAPPPHARSDCLAPSPLPRRAASLVEQPSLRRRPPAPPKSFPESSRGPAFSLSSWFISRRQPGCFAYAVMLSCSPLPRCWSRSP